MKLAFFVAAATLIGVQQASTGSDTGIPYPAAFREWTHVKSTIVGPQSPSFANNGGLHHFYANAKALEGYRTGSFPGGSILIDDLLETKDGTATGVTVEGPRRRLAVMVRDSVRFASTGGWGFEVFKGDTQNGSLTSEGRAACFACHQKATNGVFSAFRN
jgi:hypothetical protein